MFSFQCNGFIFGYGRPIHLGKAPCFGGSCDFTGSFVYWWINMERSIPLIVFIWLMTAIFLPAQSLRDSELLARDCMEAGSASILVIDLDSGKEIYAFDPQRALPTASIQKLLTTTAVLEKRGADFRYQTILGYTGKIEGEILYGDLVVIGSGDPTLGSDYFDESWSLHDIADSLESHLGKLGVRSISGGIVIDVSVSPGHHVPGGWPWADLGNYYGAGHWGLNIHDNEYRLFFKQNKTTGRLTSILRTLPEVAPFSITNEVRTGPPGSGDQAYIYAAPYSTEAVVRGTIPPGDGSFSIRGSITDPPVFFGRQLNLLLAEGGIEVEGDVSVVGDPLPTVQVLFPITSPSLIEIARVTNYQSVNLYAEALLKLLCDEEQPASHFGCGLGELKDFWISRGVEENQIFYRDGSGLSPRNTASAASFVQVLRTVYQDSKWYDELISTLPEMGRDGTLQYMLRGYKGQGRILAKSGYIGRQRSYTGYLFTESGRHLAFCVMLDNYNCSSAQMRNRIEGFLISLLRDQR